MSSFRFNWISTPRPTAKDKPPDRPLTAPELFGLKDVYQEETEGKRERGGGGKNDNAGKAKDKRLVWQRSRQRE